ncbi:kinase-like protein [Mytilinidion resinicola]|uniref:Autophagy-related protein 1 n=1 Tax=Mytilinidion resinicola TaxID=574789 RepID=A0A6A6YE68_9PEZI|nr:kinase-like protein [Mytilinidion resinicola]KAF2806858.1 kinase-like protein [Mytilinidion resinicola]
MLAFSDLVRDSRLKTRFSSKYTQHVYYVSGETPRQRKVRREERWERRESLGSGSFGTVWLEKLTAEHARYRAVKEIRKIQRGSNTISYGRELEAIAKFSHEKYELCFVKSYGWYENDASVFIAMEYFPNGDLQSYLSSPLPEKEVQQITFQILEALSFMHENGFAHRDLKPSVRLPWLFLNILVKSKSPDWWVKVGDFGISKRAEDGLTALRTFSGTPGFLAPELLVQNGLLDSNELKFGNEYTTAVDIWALGEIVFRALTGQAPFARSLGAYIRGTSPFPVEMMLSNDISGEGCDFVKSLMAPLPKDRPTAPIAEEHTWMESLRPSSPRSSVEFER